MKPRLSGYMSVLSLVFYVLKSLLGITRQLSCEKFAIVVLRRYRTQLLVPVPPECWIFKMASPCYFLVSSYRSALFALSKSYLDSISSFLICPPAAEHTLQRNMTENSRRGLIQTRRDLPVYKKILGNYNKCEFSNFFLFQWPKMIISFLVTWMIVDCNLAVRVVLSF